MWYLSKKGIKVALEFLRSGTRPGDRFASATSLETLFVFTAINFASIVDNRL